MGYERTIKLSDNEGLMVVNKETGEVRSLPNKFNNIPKGKDLHKYTDFSKVNSRAISFLEGVLSNEELGILFKMIRRADYGSNAMLPLNSDYSYRELSEEFGIGRHKVRGMFKKLFDLGVYAQVNVANGINSEYWTLSPYISWRGRFIDRAISVYFSDTIIARQVM